MLLAGGSLLAAGAIGTRVVRQAATRRLAGPEGVSP